MERKLASLQIISDIQPIEGADMIELAIVNGWKVVVGKSVGHQIGNMVVYCEIDSFLPVREEFEFLRKTSFKKMGTDEGFRLKTIRLRGQISQGLILPMSVFGDFAWTAYEGLDVTERLGIVKYEPPMPAQLSGVAKGYFPSFLRKTDEERIQNLVKDYSDMKDKTYYVTEKLDGSSATYYMKDGEFGVCSRNLELAEPEEFVEGMIMCEDGIERPRQQNTFWKVAQEMKIKESLEKACKELNRNLSIQGELIGEGIQGNPYKIKGQTLRLYNVFDIDNQEYFGLPMFLSTAEHILNIPTVPILATDFVLPETIDELIKYADGKSVLNNKTDREGVVIRTLDRKFSFKAISNIFLLGEK